MKAKIFKHILTALIAFAPFVKSFAQQPATPAPAPPTVLSPVTVSGYAIAPMATYNLSPMVAIGGPLVSQDTNYNKKMRELNTKMAELRQQMSALRTEELKKQNIVRAESTQRIYRERAESDVKNFDRAFSEPRVRFNFDSDKNLQEKIKSGEVKEVSKTYNKSYTVDKNDQLSIDNKFGKVTVNTWNKNEFKVEVEIKADANDQAEAQKILDNVSVKDSKDGNGVSFTTSFADNNNSWTISSHNGTYTIHRVVINYVVYMPSKNSLSITNRYGAVTLPDLEGKVTINNSYGSLTAKKLSNPANNISNRSGMVSIETLKGSALKVSDGSLDLGTSDNLTAEISYSPAKIATLKTSGNITLRYGAGLKIGELDKNFKGLQVNSSFAPVIVGLAGDHSFNFDVTVNHGSFNYGDHITTVTDKTPDDGHWSTTKTYKGHVGKGSSDQTITITSKYASVQFN
jgi:hypothetical protein